MQIRATGLTGEKKNPMVFLSPPSTPCWPQKGCLFLRAVFCLKLLFGTGSLSRTESVSQLGSFRLPGPCVNREVCFKLCQRGLVGSYHTLARLAKVSVGGEQGGSSQGIGRTQSKHIRSAKVRVSPSPGQTKKLLWGGNLFVRSWISDLKTQSVAI